MVAATVIVVIVTVTLTVSFCDESLLVGCGFKIWETRDVCVMLTPQSAEIAILFS